jgi:hypothetical protein
MSVIDLREITAQNLYRQSYEEIFACNGESDVNMNSHKSKEHKIYSRGSVTPQRFPTS